MADFDPRLILAHQQYTGPDPHETMRTLAQLAQVRQGMDMRQAQQQRAQTLGDIYRRNAGDIKALPTDLMLGGFGPEAAEWMGQQESVAARAAQTRKAAQDLIRHRVDLLARPLRGGLKTQADLDNAWAVWRSSGLSDVELSGIPGVLNEQTAPFFRQMEAMGAPMSPHIGEEEQEAKLARAEYERAKAGALRQGPQTSEDKAENMRLRNEKLRRALGESTTPNKLLTLDGYSLSPEFEVEPKVAEALRDSQAQTRTMTKNIDELMKLYKTHGNKVLPGPARARMESIARHLQLKSKGKTMFELGVIAGPDMDLLNSVVPVPTKKDATIADFFTGGGDASETMERLRVMREQVGDNFHEAASTRGYRLKSGKGASEQGGGAAGAGPARFEDPKTGDVWVLDDPEEIQKALENKWVNVR